MKNSMLKMFGMLYGLIYFVVFYMEWASFRYYPETARFYLENQTDIGPAILWYGWMALAAVITLVISVVTPSKLVEKIPNDAVWIVNLATLIVILYVNKQWFV